MKPLILAYVFAAALFAAGFYRTSAVSGAPTPSADPVAMTAAP
ncbi:MAG: hypothetical protein VX874_22965 [Pseudomonadota bacterium]|nr:hypothetical protein [Pseudomonadota bacterium]